MLALYSRNMLCIILEYSLSRIFATVVPVRSNSELWPTRRTVQWRRIPRCSAIRISSRRASLMPRSARADRQTGRDSSRRRRIPVLVCSDERIPHRHASVPLPVGQIFAPKNAAAQFDGAVDHQCVPPGHLVTALEAHGSQQIRVAGTVNDPAAQIGQDLFGFLAGDAELFRGGGVKLREHLNADRSSPILHQPAQQLDGSLVLFAGASIVSVNQDVGVDELNAHAVLPGSSGSLRPSLCPERARCGRGTAAWLSPNPHPDP